MGSPGPATSVAIPGPCGLAFGNGDVYVASNYSGQGGTGTISAVSPSTGRLTTTAGNAAAGEPLGAGSAASHLVDYAGDVDPGAEAGSFPV